MNFIPFPILYTDRLQLRQLEIEDNAAILQLRSDENVNRFIDRKQMESIEEADVFIEKIYDSIEENKCLYWAISFKTQKKLIGTICLWNIDLEKNEVEIGYELKPEFQGKGIMDEALKQVLAFAFNTLGFVAVVAFTHRINFNSSRLLLNNNFILQIVNPKVKSTESNKSAELTDIGNVEDPYQIFRCNKQVVSS